MYEIQFVPLETFGGQITSDTVNTSDGSVLMMVLTSLEEYVEYNISVRAYTSVGPGPYSDPVTERTLEDGMNFTLVHSCHKSCILIGQLILSMNLKTHMILQLYMRTRI